MFPCAKGVDDESSNDVAERPLGFPRCGVRRARNVGQPRRHPLLDRQHGERQFAAASLPKRSVQMRWRLLLSEQLSQQYLLPERQML